MRRLLWTLLMATASAQQVNQDIIPASSGLNLGRSNQRWNGFFQNLDILGTCTVNGSPCLSVANSAQIGAGLTGQIPVYIGPLTIGPDANLDDSVTTPGTITSLLPIGMPQANINGPGGFEMTSPGGTLSAPGAATGGIGIGLNAIPQINKVLPADNHRLG